MYASPSLLVGLPLSKGDPTTKGQGWSRQKVILPQWEGYKKVTSKGQ
jgi:hypothetical protein